MHFQRQRTEGSRQKSESRSQRSEVSGRKSEVRGQSFCFLLSVLLGLTFVSGCSKTPNTDLRTPTSDLSSSRSTPTPLAPDSVLRVHWVGKQTLGVAASAYTLMRLWNLPEARQLERQLLEKFATAPGRLLTNGTAQNASTTLAPMLYDVINEESCLEIRQATGQPEQLAFAIRLDKIHAQDWHKGMADVISATEGGYPSRRAGGWSLISPRTQTTYELMRVGDWVVFGAARGTNALLQEIVARIGREQVPFTVTTTNHWLTVEADLRWVAQKIGLTAGRPLTPTLSPSEGARETELPRLSMVITGDGANAVTTGELVFAKPLALNLEPWNFPKRLVQGPVVGFAAVRGLDPWLTESKTWGEFKLGSAPNQIFTWSEARAPMQIHLAAPSDSAAAITKALGEGFASRVNAWLTEHALGSITRWPDTTGLVWKDLPMIAPYLTATNTGWLSGGTTPSLLPEVSSPVIYPRPSVTELLADIASRTNLVAYEWETTGARAESVHILGQLLRAITRHPQLPANTGSSIWLQAARNRLGNCTTTVTLTGSNRLAFERKSTTGFNALELHVLADWMESPEFPRGFYSTLSPVGPALTPNTKP